MNGRVLEFRCANVQRLNWNDNWKLKPFKGILSMHTTSRTSSIDNYWNFSIHSIEFDWLILIFPLSKPPLFHPFKRKLGYIHIFSHLYQFFPLCFHQTNETRCSVQGEVTLSLRAAKKKMLSKKKSRKNNTLFWFDDDSNRKIWLCTLLAN